MDQLPAWLYGWAVGIANAADNPGTLVIAHVLTTQDHQDRTVVYSGLLYDLALKPDGAIARMTLLDCERGLADLSSPADISTVADALSHLPFLIVEAAHIRNVVFRVVQVDEVESADGPNLHPDVAPVPLSPTSPP